MPPGAALEVVVAFAEHLRAALPDAAPPAGVVEDLEGSVGVALKRVAHSVSVWGAETGVRGEPVENCYKDLSLSIDGSRLCSISAIVCLYASRPQLKHF